MPFRQNRMAVSSQTSQLASAFAPAPAGHLLARPDASLAPPPPTIRNGSAEGPAGGKSFHFGGTVACGGEYRHVVLAGAGGWLADGEFEV